MSKTRSPDPQTTAFTLSEALPYIQRYDRRTLVVKYGGHAMATPESRDGFARDITLLRQLGLNPVVVHGGGPQIGAMLERLGVHSDFEGGLRVTDQATMEVVEMVLAGAINTSIVSAINAAGGRAVGLSGVDANLIRAKKASGRVRDPDSHLEKMVDMGFAGEPEQVDATILSALSEAGFIPVVAPVGVGEDGLRYNINADTAAGAIAVALKATRLLLMTDVVGVKAQDGSLLRTLDAKAADRLIRDGVVTGGMIPKLNTALKSVREGVEAAVILDGTAPHALLMELFTGHGAGTLIG